MNEETKLIVNDENIEDAVILDEETINEEVVEEEIGVPILNPDEEVELTEEEKKALKLQYLKESKIRFKPVNTRGNVTTNKFGNDYRKKRQQKNKAQKNSRKINRKK